MRTSWRILSRIIPFLRPHRAWMCIAIVLSVIGGLVWMQHTLLIKSLTDTAVSGQYQKFQQALYLTLAWIVGQAIIRCFYLHARVRAGAYPVRDLRDHITAHIQHLPISYTETHHTGDLTSRLTNDIDKVAQAINNIPENVWQPVWMLAGIVLMSMISWKLLLAGCVLIPLSSVVFNRVSKPIESLSRQQMEALSKITTLIQDTLGGIHIAKAFNAKRILANKFGMSAVEVEHKGLAIDRQNSILISVYLALRYIPQLVIPIYGGYLAFQGEITPGSVLAASALIWHVFLPVENVLAFLRQMRETIPAAERLFEILDQPTERVGEHAYEVNCGSAPVEFEAVSFSYNEENQVLDNLSFRLVEGETVALVGPSGSGKTTVFKLLCGFYEPQQGRIRVFGSDLLDCSPVDTRAHISFVSQDTYLFPATIAENIAYGRPGATRDEVVTAAKAANAHGFIVKQPEGYDTQVGERGAKLSGGERQRIALARAILKDAPILLLDEPTSALDTQSEALVQEALEHLMEGRTVLVVAHRLSTIHKADRILVLDKGSIRASGTHAQLLGTDTLYKRLYLKQAPSEPDVAQSAEEVAYV